MHEIPEAENTNLSATLFYNAIWSIFFGKFLHLSPTLTTVIDIEGVLCKTENTCTRWEILPRNNLLLNSRIFTFSLVLLIKKYLYREMKDFHHSFHNKKNLLYLILLFADRKKTNN